ncbi:MAG: 1-acyl-sn-glycerol-3-phosphate acyltransferase [Blautia sp.]|nr:1-acyl-sn-glycerol-3-phosphate acyltransferase [Blautia sp.]
MLRFILVCIIVLLFLILTIPVLAIEWIIGKFRPMARDISSLRIVQGVFKLILWVSGTRVTVIGQEHVPKDTPVLYIANHRSYFDILLTYCRCPGLTGYVAKKEMLRYPLLRTWMKRLYCLFLDRKDIRQGLQTILTAVDYIRQGISICIFPEGTRSVNESELDMLPFHEGSFKIATKTGCPIIPISLSNTQEIFEAHLPKIRPAHVVLEYGEPIYPADMSRQEQKQLGAMTQNLIRETLMKNRSIAGQTE